MSEGYRNGAFALGLVVGGGLVLNLFLWLDYKANYEGDKPSTENSSGERSEVGGFWDNLIETFISPSDTLAQWIMASFTIAVVLLVWRTLIATQDIARDTSRIGEAQVRAYLSAVNVQVGHDRQNGHICFRCDIFNSGQSPAFDSYALVKITLFINEGTIDYLISHEIGNIRVGSNTGTYIGHMAKTLSTEDFESSEACHVQILVKARDVFKKNIDCSGFFMVGGSPEADGSYTLKPTPNIHDLVGLRIREQDFADVIPNWRKENYG
jgi:hypothetical protein